MIYNPGSGNVTLAFLRGPQNFKPYFNGRVHDNLATSGQYRERVVENLDILVSFEMQHHIIDGDLPGWAAFLAFALAGGQFTFYPNAALTDNYNCVLEDANWEPKVNAPRKYAASFVFRVLQDSNAPPDPGQILRRFYGVTS